MQRNPTGSNGVPAHGRFGQVTLGAVLFTFVTVVLFIALLPALVDVIATGVSDVNGTDNGDITQSILNLIIPLMAIGILFSFIAYILPQRRQEV